MKVMVCKGEIQYVGYPQNGAINRKMLVLI